MLPTYFELKQSVPKWHCLARYDWFFLMLIVVEKNYKDKDIIKSIFHFHFIFKFCIYNFISFCHRNTKTCHKSHTVKSNPALPIGKKTCSVKISSFDIKFNKIQHFKNNGTIMNTRTVNYCEKLWISFPCPISEIVSGYCMLPLIIF